MKLSAKLLLASSVLLCVQARAQTLVYSLSYSETPASSRAHFANVSPFPGRRSDAENVAMLRNTRKNEVYSVSVAEGKHTLLFSDEGTQLEIKPAAAGLLPGEVYLSGTWRERRTTPNPGFYSDDGIYALSLDGSNRFRKIADDQKQGSPILNPQGTKAALIAWKNEKLAASIFAVPGWKLLASWDFEKLVQTHCPACTPTSYGWMADGNRIYVSLVVVGEEDDDSAKENHPGTYVLSGDGTDLGPIPSEIGAFQMAGYSNPNFLERNFLGQLPDARYLFLDYGVKQGKSPGQTEPFLVISSAGSMPQKQFPLKFPIDGYIAPSGKYLAYLEHRLTPNYRAELHLWVKNLESGEEKELLAAPPPNPPSSPEPNVTLSILGWINN